MYIHCDYDKPGVPQASSKSMQTLLHTVHAVDRVLVKTNVTEVNSTLIIPAMDLHALLHRDSCISI